MKELVACASPPDGARRADIDVAVLLAGGLRPTPLGEDAGCPVLDLWLTPDRTVLDAWLDQIAGVGEVDVFVLCNACDGAVGVRAGVRGHRVRAVADAAAYRGPAGALRDACLGLAPEATLLVGEAARFVDTDLAPMIEAHAAADADITVACNGDRSPAGLYLLRRPALDLVPDRGFVDIKEQWLTRAVGAGLSVVVHTLEDGWSHVLRTREQFLGAARAANNGSGGRDGTVGATGDRVVCDRAVVHESAHVLGSIVMGDATVDPDAVVVRSLVGPGAHVPRSAVVVDSVVSGVAALAG